MSYIVSIFLFILVSCSSVQKVDPKADLVNGFIPIKNDELAKRYAPLLKAGSIHGDPFALYYRASKDEAGNIHITYHFAWEKEENTTSGIGPFFSRNIYTGGLKLQKTMFGKGDLEMVSLIIDSNGIIQKVEYEIAEDYDPNKFGVKHKHVIRTEPHKELLAFEVMSWNHLFQYLGDKYEYSQGFVQLTPTYFTQSLWEEYTMIKEKEGFFSRNRAHKPYEVEYIE